MKRRLIATKKLLRRLVAVCALVVLTFATGSSRTQTVLEGVLNEKLLRVITFVGPTTYFENAKGSNGFEYFLTKAFADSLGVNLEVTLIDNLDALLNALGGPRGDFAAAGLTVTEKRQQFIRFSDPYSSVRQILVYHRGEPQPDNINDLIDGRLLVIANSSHSEHLTELKKDHPLLQWEALRDTEMLELMQLVHDGQADYAVVDSTAFFLDRGLYPKARAAFDLTGDQAIAWAFSNHGDTSLIKAANQFLHDYRESGELQRLTAQFHHRTDEFSIMDSHLLMTRIDQRLGQYQPLFESIAGEKGLDWRMLAAMAYQESLWDPQATSPTGVRGLMMLTQDTAAELKIEDRLDPEQSIRGGAEYFYIMRNRIPEDIKEPDRTWFALAAYNVGLGHLEDARVLTERHNGNPDLWSDVRKHLPLLQKKKYYRTVKYGYARGGEPVQYVQNVRRFKSILQWHTMQQARQKALLENELSTDDVFSSDQVLPL
ncbi:MAG: membrane-bound lytic murein transglycosylase MltF [Gammaproteobacteria bacterium]|nr:MAG: membrane-bound lytic murein transglycosylase MltF [Gammaproteobacteria bacterium]RLA53569.1 MAG: membrane-bound lytic murein transglycosylase MltF [Gammaproteobacteria bacterium]